MRKSLYLSLAIQNIKKNYRTVIPYLCTCVITIMMFSILDSLRTSAIILQGVGGGTMSVILLLGRVVVGAFSILFIFYTNSFLIKKRMKEFGVYNVLGLEKKHIILIISYETIILSVLSLLLGLFLGVAFSKISQLLLFKLMGLAATNEFTLSISSIILTCVVFAGIFFLVFLNTIRMIAKSNPIELIRQESAGEKEPKANWLVALIGFITLGAGYYLAQSIDDPVMAIMLFFLAVILVIVGTFCLFTSGSIVILKALKKNKKFYYKTKNFTAVSGMIYRMKRNAAGLANICILSTCVLVMISTTFSLYFNIGDIVDKRFVRDISVTARSVPNEEVVIETDSLVNSVLEQNQVVGKNVSNYKYAQYDYSNINGKLVKYEDINPVIIMTISLSEYNRLTNDNITLADDELLMLETKYFKDKDTLSINDVTYKVTTIKDDKNVIDSFVYYATPIYVVIVNDMDVFYANSSDNYVNTKYIYMVDVDVDDELETSITDQIREQGKLDIYQSQYSVDGKIQNSQTFFELYGSLLFIGVFLSVLFLIATVLIIYYKQITEGYEDVRRFDIMKKVGMSQKEVSSSIRRQVLMVFFIPIVMATIHIGFAFKMISLMVGALSMNNTELFFYCTLFTVVIFSAVYAIVYALTSRTYNHIVNQK
ncbi:MAG: ABC transporter permease [Anaerorhabdus sp.]|uniref:ABC transporter permease n=1 Tax=Anaerorhabdus sp. TaxID=1872524 RepID=UPI002B21CEB5|nr:ABC transporter permease [Anaerorhabdus sp.]MEA4874795.1 ABC transporter permease [Anaerorhabdus sp.]